MIVEEFRARAAEYLEPMAYAVTATEDGFVFHADLADVVELEQRLTHHVKVRDNGTFSITDKLVRVSRGGLHFSAEWQAGRIPGRWERVYGRREDGTWGKISETSAPSEDARNLVIVAGHELGLRNVRGAAERIGLFFALLALVGFAVSAAVVAVLLALGKL